MIGFSGILPRTVAMLCLAAMAGPVVAQRLTGIHPPAARETAEQDAAHVGRRAGELKSFDDLLPRAQRAAGGSEYLGVEPNIHARTYRFKFMRGDGRVVWVDVDGRTGSVLSVR